MQVDRQFRNSGRWDLATDGVQWVLQRYTGGGWRAVSFVRSGKDILARCMKENGTPQEDAARLLEGLPSDFDTWVAGRTPDAA